MKIWNEDEITAFRNGYLWIASLELNIQNIVSQWNSEPSRANLIAQFELTGSALDKYSILVVKRKTRTILSATEEQAAGDLVVNIVNKNSQEHQLIPWLDPNISGQSGARFLLHYNLRPHWKEFLPPAR